MTKEEYENCKVGDIVICNTSFEDLPQKGWKGRIIKKTSLSISLEWENAFYYGHSCNDLGINFCCRFYYFACFASLDQNISILDLYKPEQLEFKF